MAWITLPSGVEIDLSHIVRITRRSETLTGGGTRNYRTLHFDNNDIINLKDSDITAFDAAITSSGTADSNVNITNSGNAEKIPVQVLNSGANEAVPTSIQTAAATTTTRAAQTTTDSYANLGADWNKTGLKSFSIAIRNEGSTNAGHFRVLGSLDGTNFFVISTDPTSVPASSTVRFSLSDYVTHVRIQIKAAVAASQTNMSASAAAVAV